MLLYFLIPLVSAITEKDLYEILRTEKSASKREIKSAYKKLAMQYHPDKNSDPSATELFQEVNYAKEILLDDEKRALYDECGHKCLNEQGGNESGFNPFDIFQNFFGGGQEMQEMKGQDTIVPVEISLEEVYTGARLEFTRVQLTQVWAEGTRDCNCRVEMRQVGSQNGGFQIFQEQVCDQCDNFRFEEMEFNFGFEVSPGMEAGQEFLYVGAGEVITDGEPGDLRLTMLVPHHDRFHRVGDDLYTNVTISLEDALVGFTTILEHLNGSEIMIERTGTTWPGFKQRLRGKGMPVLGTSSFGALIITFDVAFPEKNFSLDEQKMFETILQTDFQPQIYNGFKTNPTKTY